MSRQKQAEYWRCSKTTVSDRRAKWDLLFSPKETGWQPKIKKCKLCDEDFTTIKYGHSRVYCYDCSPLGAKQIVTNLRHRAKEIAVQQLGGKCIRCNNDKIYVLDFHHKDPKEKEFTIGSTSSALCFNMYKEEVKKCVLFCANCHREFHWLQNQKSDLTIEEYCNLKY